MPQPQPEPWLRGPLDGVPAFLQPLFFSFQQVREDLARFTAGLTEEQVWQQVDRSSIGFHMKHIAGSVDRLTTYLLNEQLTPAQLETLENEHIADLSLPSLLQLVDSSLNHAQSTFLRLDPKQLLASRSVGRKSLPTTVLGLLVHIAEHTQRHLGQAITLAKLVRQQG